MLKEAELLRYFLRHVGETLDRPRLLQVVWDYETFPTTRTVDTHVLNLRKMIEVVPEQPAHLLTVHRVGYRLVMWLSIASVALRSVALRLQRGFDRA